MSLQGSWKIASLEMNGMSMPGGGAMIHVNGDQFRTDGMGAVYAGTLVVNDTVQPWHVDMVFTEGPEKGNTNLCICEPDAEGYKLCIAMRGTIRPTSFDSKGGFVVETLRRA